MATYSKNLSLVANDLVEGEASILILGDSINNPTQSGYMRIGYRNEWNPNSWKGICPGFSNGNGIANCFNVEATRGSNITGFASTNGPNPNDADVVGTWAEGLHYAIGGVIEASRITDTVGGNSADNNADFELFRVTPLSSSVNEWAGSQDGNESFWADSSFAWKSLWYANQDIDIQAWYRGGTFADSIVVQHSLTAGWNVLDGAVGNSASAGNLQFTGFYSKGDVNDELQCTSVMGYATDRTGMTMSYAGAGGWGVSNHAYSDNINAAVVPITGQPGWYTDDAITQHMNFVNCNIVMIWLGQNNSAAEYSSDLGQIIARFRALRPGVKFLVVSTYDTSDTRTKFTTMADFARSVAGEAGFTDVAFLDLNKLVFDNHGAWSTWRNTYLDTGEDPIVHPVTAGAEEFARLMWSEIENINTNGDPDEGGGGFEGDGNFNLDAVTPGIRKFSFDVALQKLSNKRAFRIAKQAGIVTAPAAEYVVATDEQYETLVTLLAKVPSKD